MRRVTMLAVLLVLFSLSAQAQGPVVLMGIDAEDFGHPPAANYSTVMGSVYNTATNGGTGTLVIGGGKSATDDVTTFWNALSGVIGPITYVNGAANITAQSFAGFRMIGVVSDNFNTFGGGLTNVENDALTGRAAAIAAFVNGGGGLLGFSSAQLSTPYGYLGALGTITSGAPPQQDNITPTVEGLAVGVTDALDGCCWHDSYLTFPGFLNILAYYPGVTGQPAAAVGGQQVIITNNCPYGQGFWKNHGEDACHSGNNADFWPASAFPMILGTNVLAKADACEIIRLNSTGGNALRSLARQLIAAKLNIANGSPSPDPVPATIAQADLLIGALDPRTSSVSSNTPLGQAMNAAAGVLDLYNNNLIEPVCVPPPPAPKSGYTRPNELAAQNLYIEGNHPNPVSGGTSISYTLRESGNAVLAVYNTLGAKVRELVNRSADAGSYSVQWDGLDESGRTVSNGTYYIKLMMSGQTATSKITVAR
jgi:hypothetical protein